MPDILFADFETRSAADLKKCGADIYARDPSTRVMAFGYAFNDEPILLNRIGEKPEPAIIDHVASGGTVVAHNAPFEWVIWNFVWRREHPELPELKSEQLTCTMAMAYAMALPGSLEKAALAAGIDAKKDMKGQRVMLQLSQPRDYKPDGSVVWWTYEANPQKWETMYSYCVQDIEVERQLYKRLMLLTKKEKELWELDHLINQRGVCVDVEAIKAAIKLVEFEQDKLDREMHKLTNGFVPTCTSVSLLTQWVKNQGVELDGIAKNDVADLLEADIPELVKRALVLRQEAGKSSTAKLKSMLFSACTDDRVRSIFQYHGAGTGRWAGRRIQPQNFPRPKIKQQEIDSILEMLKGVQ